MLSAGGAPTSAWQGRIGAGNASVHLRHNYGNLALSLSSNAPSAFSGVLLASEAPARAPLGSVPQLRALLGRHFAVG